LFFPPAIRVLGPLRPPKTALSFFQVLQKPQNSGVVFTIQS
jgi:hypothetical protein